jgi:IclR family acetate operon transcriptional repressor
MTNDRIEQIVKSGGLPRFTERTLTDLAELAEDLDATRKRGHAIDDEAKSIGMRCIAAPVFDVHEEAAAGISVSGPTIRMGPEKSSDLAVAVKDAAAALTAATGGVAPTRPLP